MVKCNCGAATEGKWADIHHPGCTSLQEAWEGELTAEEQAMIDKAWETHRAAAPAPAKPPFSENLPPSELLKKIKRRLGDLTNAAD